MNEMINSVSIDHINWYPGHMKKARGMIQENLKLVDLVLEVVDARIPISGRNPDIKEIVSGKNQLLLLNKTDLADECHTESWIGYFTEQEIATIKINGKEGHGIKHLIKELEKLNLEKRESGNKKPFRTMIVGVPNSGKSSILNRLIGTKSARVGNKPGFTKGKQWVTFGNKMQILDTPGILWPKFDNYNLGLNLAFCGSIRDEIMDISDLALELIRVLSDKYPENLRKRYKLEKIEDSPLETMEKIAKNRKLLKRGGEIDYQRTGHVVVDEFRSGAIGRMTLDTIE